MNKFLLIGLIICLSITSASCASTPSESMMVKKLPVSSGTVSTPTHITRQPVTSTGQSSNTSPLPDLTGTWTASGVGTYWVRQINNDVWWVGMSSDQGSSWTNAFKGTIHGNQISGEYVNTPRGTNANDHGQLSMQVSADGNTMTDSSGQVFTRTTSGQTTKKPIGGLGLSHLPVQVYNPPSQTPIYKFVIDNCQITNTRSVHEDTDYANLGVAVGNALVNGGTQTKSLGNLNNGVHTIDLEVGPTPVANDPNTPVIIAFQIVNSGHTDYSTIVDAMSAGTGALITAFVPVPGVGTAAGFVAKYLGGIFTANCDGPVAVDKIVTNGEQIAEWTANGPHSVTKNYPGTDSPTGCGSNSQYDVTWHVEKVS